MYSEWLNQNDNRENEMVKNIYNYCYRSNYGKALFLVGAAHRKSLINKISKFEINKKQNLDWIFDYFGLQYKK